MSDNATRVFARCHACKVRIVISADQINADLYQDDQITVSEGVAYHMPCFPANTLAMTLSGVKATLRPTITCDVKCTHATSPICKCSCGGANHGSHA